MPERRSDDRVESFNLSYICVDEDGQTVGEGMGRTLNVSTGGLLLETTFCIEPGRTVQLTLALEDRLLDFRGTVVYSSTTDENLCQNGVRFLEMDADARSFLAEFIADFKEKGQGKNTHLKL